MNTKKYVATFVDSGENCTGKATAMGIYDTEEAAMHSVKLDMEDWYHEYKDTEELEIDYAKMSARLKNGKRSCEWNVEEVDVL